MQSAISWGSPGPGNAEVRRRTSSRRCAPACISDERVEARAVLPIVRADAVFNARARWSRKRLSVRIGPTWARWAGRKGRADTMDEASIYPAATMTRYASSRSSSIGLPFLRWSSTASRLLHAPYSGRIVYAIGITPGVRVPLCSAGLYGRFLSLLCRYDITSRLRALPAAHDGSSTCSTEVFLTSIRAAQRERATSSGAASRLQPCPSSRSLARSR